MTLRSLLHERPDYSREKYKQTQPDKRKGRLHATNTNRQPKVHTASETITHTIKETQSLKCKIGQWDETCKFLKSSVIHSIYEVQSYGRQSSQVQYWPPGGSRVKQT